MKRYWAYFKYLLRHRWRVMVECWKMGLYIQGVTHDLSKWRPSEFLPYARHFFGQDGVRNKDMVSPDAAFDAAWLKHGHRNPHHWQHWLLLADNGVTKVLPMPSKYRAEMLADWRSFEGSTSDWYARHRDKILLHPETRAWIDEQLEYLDSKKRYSRPIQSRYIRPPRR